jgi:hypothetical protein
MNGVPGAGGFHSCKNEYFLDCVVTGLAWSKKILSCLSNANSMSDIFETPVPSNDFGLTLSYSELFFYFQGKLDE